MEGEKRHSGHWPYMLGLVVLTFFFFIGYYDTSLPAHDISTYYYPGAELLKISALEYGDYWPLWNPYGFSGTPFLMKPLLGMDSLLGLLLLMLPNTVIALKMTYVLLFLLAGISMYFLVVYLGFEKKYALISALVYMLNGHMVKLLIWGWLTTLGGYALLPLAFLFGIKAIKEKAWFFNSVVAGVVFAVLFRLNPDMKVAMWLGLMFGAYLMFNLVLGFSPKRIRKTLMVGGIIVALFFGLSAVRMLPNVDYISISSRGDVAWEQSSSRQLEYRSTFDRVVEPLYEGMPKVQRPGKGDHVGMVAFLLGGFAIYKKRKNKHVVFFGLLALLSVLIATNTFGLYRLFWVVIPFFKSLRYIDRSLFLFAFSFSVLAGIGASVLVATCKRKRVVYGALVGLLFLNLWVFNYSHYNGGSTEEWTDTQDLLSDNEILNYLSEQDGLFRITTWETRGIDWGTDLYNVPRRLEHIFRYDPIWYPPYMNEFLGAAFRDPAKFWGMLNLKFMTARESLNVSGFMFVKQFKDCASCFPDNEPLKKAWGPYLYENAEFLPRAYMVEDSVVVIGDTSAVTQTMYALLLDERFDPRTSVIIRGRQSVSDYTVEELKKYSAMVLVQGSNPGEGNFKLQLFSDAGGVVLPDVLNSKGTIDQEDISKMFSGFNGSSHPIKDSKVSMITFDERRVSLEGEEGFLVYSEKFSVFDGWGVTDAAGGEVTLFNANVMNSAVYLDGGERSLRFRYAPKSYTVGLFITIFSFLLVLWYFGCLFYKKKWKREKETHE